MEDFQVLLDQFWVRKSEDRETYTRLRRNASDYAGTVNELLGWNMVMNDAVVKLEKVPVQAKPWMGIQEFTEPMDYCLLCALLLYLADEDAGRQFLLTNLTERIKMITADVCPVDWAKFTHRKSLVRVLRYAREVGLLLVYDGDSERFGSDQGQEVLFHNTGLCHHFTVHFGRDIGDLHTVEDFEAALGGDPERDRRRRICRQLAMEPAVYWHQEDSGEYNYVKHQHNNLERRLNELMRGTLQVHRNGAFYALEQNEKYGEVFPSDKGIADIALEMCSVLRERVLSGAYRRTRDDMAEISLREFGYRLSEVRKLYSGVWSRGLREMSEKGLTDQVLNFMESWMLIEVHGETVLITPAAGKWNGHYPEDIPLGGEEDGGDKTEKDTETDTEEDENEPLENA